MSALPPVIKIGLFLHFILSAAIIFFILRNKSTLTPANILPCVIIPVFGPISAIVAEFTNRLIENDAEAIAKEFQSIGEDIYWKSLRQPEAEENIVPLEEALIINDRATRKQLVFDTLLEDPMRNIDILLLARENNDVDTAHYANTTIAKIQRDFQLQIQRLSVEYEKNPDNLELLNRYIQVLAQFIDSGLSEAFLLKKQRTTLAELLNKKINRANSDRNSLIMKIENSIELGTMDEANNALRVLMLEFPNDEQTWINALRISVASRDSVRLDQTLRMMQSREIAWTSEGKSAISLWTEKIQ